MRLALPPELRKFINSKVRSGAYVSPDEVLESAVARWKAEEEVDPRVLKRLVAEGQSEADRGELIDAEQVFRGIRAKSAKIRKGRK